MAKRNDKGIALFYTRDSGGKHETTPTEYVTWARGEAEKLGATFTGTPDAIKAIIRDGQSVSGDLFLDFGVKGNMLSRPGLNALLERVRTDSSVSHVMIPRRDRLARPDRPEEGVQLENSLRQEGVTLVFMDLTLKPLGRRQRSDIGETLSAMVAYDNSGKDLSLLAQKVLHAQLGLARQGFSTGGRPPYGFRRWLVKEDGTQVRKLDEGEHVKRSGHHVVWLPEPGEEWDNIQRILKMLDSMPASQVAKTLTAEGVPTPDHGRCRTDNGVTHTTSGVWHSPTITGIARNPLLRGEVEYGRRSMGSHLRFTPEGPRELDDVDFRDDVDKPKVIRNAEEDRITAKTKFESPVAPEEHRQLIAKLDKRAGSQRGKPRSRSPKNNPLGCRVFDINCGWPMYRKTRGKTFDYACGLYMQSHGAKCDHNKVEGPVAAQFMLSCVQQRLLSPRIMEKLEARVQQLAAADEQDNRLEKELAKHQAKLTEAKAQLDLTSRNLALAESEQQRKAISTVFDQLFEQVDSLQKQVTATKSQLNAVATTDSSIDTAMSLVGELVDLASLANEGVQGRDQDWSIARQLFDLVDAKLFLCFQQIRPKKRIVNKIASGVVTFGAAPPPIEIYQGPTAPKKLKNPTTDVAGLGDHNLTSPPESAISSGTEAKSLRNISRGERI